MKKFLWFTAAFFCFQTFAGTNFPPASDLSRQSELPDPLVMFNGPAVTTKKQWVTERKPELKELFQHYMYGYFPAAPRIKSKVERVDKNFFDGKATLKLVTISFGPKETPPMNLLLVIPNNRKMSAPVFVGMNFSGNHALLSDTRVPLPTGWVPDKSVGATNNAATETGRGTQIDVWAIEQSIDRGYAVASFYCGDIQADKPDATTGVRSFFHAKKNGKFSHQNSRLNSGADEWGTIAAWAWGIQRAVDYLVTDKDLDKTKIAVVGHSRLGKTAILAGAFDERIALVIPLQAGTGGTSPSRSEMGGMPDKVETVKRINEHFPHWFCDEFKKFNDQPEKLPFDQNCLIALCAPRPVLLAAATEDVWANPPGQFEMLKGADKVYRLFGTEGLGAVKMPEPDTLIDSTLGFYLRPGKHAMTKGDWKIFLDFADKHFGKN